jgi:UDP-N-acetylmuramoyl-L-alanyl-D-glutamate--2,6-diaminopimelate ligase
VPAPRPRGLPAVPLRRLAEVAGVERHAEVGDLGDVAVTGVTLDSRAVQPGDLYAALPGAHHHGATFAAEAEAAGAVAVLSDVEVTGLPQLLVEDPRDVLGAVAAEVYGHPADALTMIGVTGTDGKTTMTYLLEAGLVGAGHTTGVIGTVETRLGAEVMRSVRTTPEATDLHALLAVARQKGVEAVAMEVSSHALALHRVDGVRYVAAAFTGLSQDHLDFHGSMDRYFTAKASLFRPDRCGTAVICLDSEWGDRLVERVRLPLVTYATGDPRADWTVADIVADARGSRFRALGPGGEDVAMRVALPGSFNVANALGALATLVAIGLDPSQVAAGIAAAPGVPGRLERVEAGQPYAALVDYAHTPDAVARVLGALRPLTPGRLVVVLGAGGDRDPGKRPAMARAAVAGADLAVLTSDNPRSEDPLAILAAMTDGLVGRHVVEPDRRAAIVCAATGLGPGDTLLVAGKGHETGQEIAGVVHPFDDRVVLAEVVSA